MLATPRGNEKKANSKIVSLLWSQHELSLVFPRFSCSFAQHDSFIFIQRGCSLVFAPRSQSSDFLVQKFLCPGHPRVSFSSPSLMICRSGRKGGGGESYETKQAEACARYRSRAVAHNNIIKAAIVKTYRNIKHLFWRCYREPAE